MWIVSADLTEVAGGTDLIKRTLKAFVPESTSTTLLVDLHAYDCWPALASLEDTNASFADLNRTTLLNEDIQTYIIYRDT